MASEGGKKQQIEERKEENQSKLIVKTVWRKCQTMQWKHQEIRYDKQQTEGKNCL